MWRFYEDKEFVISSQVPTRERPCEKHMLEFEESICQAKFHESFATQAKSRVTRETLFLDDFECAFSHTFTIQTLITYEIVTKSFFKKLLKEKTLAKYLRVKDCIPIIIYTISLKFPLLLPLHLHILERFLAQTLTLPNLSVERSFGAYGKH